MTLPSHCLLTHKAVSFPTENFGVIYEHMWLKKKFIGGI